MLDALGWFATAVFSASYFQRRATSLRRTQAVAACLWIAYGIAIRAMPVVIANVIVAAAAIYSSRRQEKPSETGGAVLSGDTPQ